MRRARTVLLSAPVLSLGLVLFGAGEAETREGIGEGTITVTCSTNPCVSTSENETILGTNDHEQIHARQGSDQLSGFGGSDIIAGDANLQEDRFLATRPGLATLTDGNDWIDAGPGNDGPVKGFGGSDVLLGAEGNDTIDAREFSQKLGNDFVGGGPGDDSIVAEDGTFDDIECGDGEDTITSLDEGLDSVSSNCENVFSSEQ
jgi:Ca2+-binding RTX toxin-like protein